MVLMESQAVSVEIMPEYAWDTGWVVRSASARDGRGVEPDHSRRERKVNRRTNSRIARADGQKPDSLALELCVKSLSRNELGN
jgi:hypothetical protein